MDKKIKVFIVENDVGSIESLKTLLNSFTYIEVVGFCGDVAGSAQQIKALKPDLLFLDIELNGGSGFDLLHRLQDYDFDVIFTTAFEGFAIDAIKLSALDYLLKPFGLDDVSKALDKLMKRPKASPLIQNLVEHNTVQRSHAGKIALNASEGIHYISLDQILYCKADSNYTYFHIENASPILVSQPLKKYDSILEPFRFFRIHQSYLINLNKVSQFKKQDGGYVQMTNGQELPVSRRRKEALLISLKYTLID